jgi:translation initiation factor 2 alpha subunit (eIF-2alpha)
VTGDRLGDWPTTMPTRWFQEQIPHLDSIVIADVIAISDVAVSCTLPSYGGLEAMLPTSEIPVRRGQAISDYVRVGKLIAVQVIRTAPLDVSMKRVREEEAATALTQYHRDAKVDLIVRTAAEHDSARIEALYRDVIWPLKDALDDAYEDVYSVFEEICAQGSTATMVLPVSIPDTLVRAIRSKVVASTYTASKEVTIRFGTSYEGVQALTTELNRLGRMEGIRVLITAPPKFKLIATDQTQTRAAARLAAAVATIPPAY